MKILAFDAALGPFSVALDLDGAITSDRSAENDALEYGLDRIARLLGSAGLDVSDLDRIGVSVGPGSFTGIRIALSFAKALSYGAGVPLVGISSFDVLNPSPGDEASLTVIGGRPGVICARLRAGGTQRDACGPASEVIRRLFGGLAPQSRLALIAAREDVFPEVGEGGLTVQRTISLAASNPAVTIAGLARHRIPTWPPHGVAPEYGELPAVTVPKAGTEFGP